MRLFLLWAIGSLCLSLYGQSEMTQSLRDNLNYGSFNPGPNRAPIYGVGQSQGKIVGDVYLDSTFNTAEIFFYSEVVRRYDPSASDSIGGYKVRVDVVNYDVEFQLNEGAKALDESAIRKIRWQSKDRKVTLVNTRQYAGTGEMKGFFELLSEGKLTVLRYTRLKVVQPTYNVALDVGTKDAKLFKKTEYYYIKNTQTLELTKFKPTKKSLLELMKSKKTKMERYMDEQNPELKNTADLIKVLDFYNQESAKQ